MKLMNKRIISLLLALVMILGMMPVTAFAAEETEANPWSGRSAVFVGDSITAGSGTTKIYYEYLEESLSFGSVTPMGVAGSCISAASDYGTDNQPLINRYQSIPAADLIVIFMGTNDYGHETPLGTVEDTEDGTFYGALNTIIPALVSKHTSSKLVFVAPLHRYGFGTSKILGTQFTSDDVANGVGAPLGDYVDALKTVCANNGVSVIDLYTECTLDPSDAEVRAAYMPDGLHPNAAGHEVIAGIMESHLRTFESVESEPIVQNEMVQGNKFASGNNQSCRASSRVNYYLKTGTVITLRNPDAMQWACAKTSNESSSNNLGYFPDSGWSDKETAVVAEDGWVGFTFKYRDETQSFDLTKPLSDYITIEEPHTHTYENGICTGCGATVSPYLQQLPENITGCTNLYDSLVPVKGYYTATKYDTSNGNVLSVVIPVEPGDRIAASSFGPVSENMGSANGIRVTYLLGNEIVSSLSAGDVYSGYTTNGYITVPDGVDAVCVPWWVPSDSNWLTLSQLSKDFAVHIPKTVSAQAPTCTESGYTAGEICEICNASLGEREEIPATGHSYSGDTCTVCGTVNLLAFLDGKYVSVLGDSISTFNGYSNNAAVNTTIGGNGPRYDAGTADTKPGSYCLLESVNDTWWMHFANRSGMKLLVNNSWAGSQVFGGQTSDGRVIPAAYLDRCVNLHDNTLENNPENAPINPDVIFVYLGINDYNFNRSNVGTGIVDYAGLVGSDGSYATPATFGEAYGIMLHKMRNAYPDAQIFAMTLLPENLYSVDKTAWEQHNAYIRAAAEYYDIPVVDLAENCAITWENYSAYMIDKIHPTTAGMKLISDCVEAELVAYYQENLSHTHAYISTVTAPTCTEQGYTTYTCECGDTYRTSWLDPTAYEGKTIACIGDSITAAVGVAKDENDYVKLLSQQLGMEYIRLGVSGTTLCTGGSRTCNISRLTEEYLEGADIVTIALGINDFCAAGTGYYELGDLNSTDSSTIYGAARMWCERIIALRKTDCLKDTQFYFVTPVICSWNNSVTSARNWDQSKTNIHGYTLRDLCNAIIEVAEKYDVAVIDLNLLSGMYYVDAEDNNTAIFGGDGVHPGATGHSMMAKAMAHALLQNNLRNDHAHAFGSWITTTWSSCLTGEQQRVCTICSATESRVTEANTDHTYTSTITAPTCTEAGYTTYTCTLCGDSYVDDYVNATGHTYENGICTACGVADWDTDGDGVLEILAIGNSFSIDALEYTYQIAQDLDIDEIAVGNLYISGCTLATHAHNAAGDLGEYRYYYNDSGTWTTTDNYKISTALESRSWDYVSLQQSSKYSGVESTYNEDLTALIAYVQERSDAKLVWHMTWAYQQDSTNSAFSLYQSNQMTMYNAIVCAVINKIVPNTDIDLIVPNGTAVQNSRTSLLGDTTTRDGYHMSRDYGQYLTGLLFIKTVTGLSVNDITYAPSGVDAQEMLIAIESVNNACSNPFAVTESVYTGEAPEAGFILLQSELYKGAFWSPVSEQYDKLFYDRSMSHKYFATIRFTKETLPVGSIIILADGWRYRPDGWITDTVQPEPREPMTAESYVIVTEEWWKDYTIRSFNVSRTDGGSVMDLTEEEMRSIFRIYVPEDKHSHNYSATVTAPTCTEKGYTTYTCTLCGDSYVDDYVDATGHTYENGICTICEAGDPNWNSDVDVVFINEKTTIPHTVNGRTVTVDYELPCSAGYWDEAQQSYIAIPAVEDEDGGYRFTAPVGAEKVLLVITGDTNGDGRVTASDIARLNAHLKNKTVLTAKELFAADVNHDGRLDDADKSAMSAAVLGIASLQW